MQTYLLKAARSGEDGEKVLVVLEAGVRFHATAYARDKNDLPGPFCMKLRKHLRGKRVAEVAQLGVDRIVDFTFGHGDTAHHLLLEIYAAVRAATRRSPPAPPPCRFWPCKIKGLRGFPFQLQTTFLCATLGASMENAGPA